MAEISDVNINQDIILINNHEIIKIFGQNFIDIILEIC